jgi:endonuclease/exonuclease/phosphatase family metal-dependent hydrolase
VLLFLLGGCASAPRRTAETPTGPHLRVLTYNVHYEMPEAEATAAAIEASNADIVCLQETNADWETFLRHRLGQRYPHIEFRHYKHAGGQAVLSRWPLKQLAYVQPSEGWFPGWLLQVATSVGPVQLLSVHLHPTLSERGNFTVPAIFTTRAKREREMQDLCKHLRPDLPTLVLGDFNEAEDGRAVRHVLGKGYTSALAEFDPESATWRYSSGLVKMDGRYDHILYSKDFRSYHASVLKSGGSDHYAVLAIIGPVRSVPSPMARREADSDPKSAAP